MKNALWKPKNIVLLRILLCLLLGLLIFFNPTAVVKWLLYVIAGVFMLFGAVEIISYFRTQNEIRFFSFSFVGGMILILFGALLIIRSSEIANFLHVIMGVVIVLSGANAFMQSRNLRQEEPRASRHMLIYALAILVVGIFIVFNPFTTQVLLYRFFGLTMTVMGISDFIWFLRYRKFLT